MSEKNSQNIPTKYKEAQWVFPKEGEVWTRESRRRYIKNLIETIGLPNVDKKDLAKKMGVSRKTLYNDIDHIYDRGLDPNSVKKLKLQGDASFGMIQRELHRILLQGKESDKIRACQTLTHALGAHTEFLEKFGVKPIVALPTDTKITVGWAEEPEDNEEE